MGLASRQFQGPPLFKRRAQTADPHPPPPTHQPAQDGGGGAGMPEHGRPLSLSGQAEGDPEQEPDYGSTEH